MPAAPRSARHALAWPLALLVMLAIALGPVSAFAAEITGTDEADVITPTTTPGTTDGTDEVNAGGGNDTVDGGGGDDTINGGNEVPTPGPSAGPGGDYLEGGTGNDTVNGDGGNDQVFGDHDNNFDAEDTTPPVIGGNDSLDGGAGDDYLQGDPDVSGDCEGSLCWGTDELFGGIDTINGGAGDDVIVGDGYAEELTGGDDIITGGGEDDCIFGEFGYGGEGDGGDYCEEPSEWSSEGGNDTIDGGNGDDTIFGQSGDDVIEGSAGDDWLYGGDGNDVLCGSEGTNHLEGGDGVDIACAHDDTLTVTNGAEGSINVKANDELLNDEDQIPVQYEIEFCDPTFFANCAIDADGNVTFTAVGTGTGVIRYRAFRNIPPPEVRLLEQIADVQAAVQGGSNANMVFTLGQLLVTVLPITTPPTTTPPTHKPPKHDNDDDDSDDSDDDSDDSDDDQPAPFNPGSFTQPTDEPTVAPETTEPPEVPEVDPPVTTPEPQVKPTGGPLGRTAAGGSLFLALMIVAAVIAALGRSGGLAAAANRKMAFADRDDETAAREVALKDAEGPGDRSFTWRFPGHQLFDRLSLAIPDKLSPFSPLLGRVADDGSELRAMIGSLWLLAPLAGVGVGLAAIGSTGGEAIPPPVWILIAGAVLATFDAFAGALALVVFAAASVLSGRVFDGDSPDVVHSLLVLLAFGFLWMAIPLIGSAIRPFRRIGDPSVRHTWDRVGDGVIAALLCGWVAQKLTGAMDLFAGSPTGLPEHANTVAIAVMAAVAFRVGVEHFSLAMYPRRLASVEAPGEPPPAMLWAAFGGAFMRTAVFSFIGWAFIGTCWQWVLGSLIFLIPQLIQHLRDRFRTVGPLHKLLPRGLVEVFVLIVACTLAARYAMNSNPEQLTAIRWAFLLISLPPAIIGAATLFTEDDDRKPSWLGEFLGLGLLVATTALALQGWDY